MGHACLLICVRAR